MGVVSPSLCIYRNNHGKEDPSPRQTAYTGPSGVCYTLITASTRKNDAVYRPCIQRVWPNCLQEEDGDHVHAGAAYATGSSARGSRWATVQENPILYIHRRSHHRMPRRLYGNRQAVKRVLDAYQTVPTGTL